MIHTETLSDENWFVRMRFFRESNPDAFFVAHNDPRKRQLGVKGYVGDDEFIFAINPGSFKRMIGNLGDNEKHLVHQYFDAQNKFQVAERQFIQTLTESVLGQ